MPNNKINNTHYLSDTNKMERSKPKDLMHQQKSEKHQVLLKQCSVSLELTSLTENNK